MFGYWGGIYTISKMKSRTVLEMFPMEVCLYYAQKVWKESLKVGFCDKMEFSGIPSPPLASTYHLFSFAQY